jgi:hypothetical protein
MKRTGSTTLIAIAAMGLLAVAMVCGTVVYLAGKPAPTGGDTKPKARLAELVPDDDSRARLSAFFADFAAVLTQESKPCRTTGDFREAYQLAVKPMKTATRLPDVKAIDEPISQRIAQAIGTADTALDGEPPLRSNLAATLTAISDDFGGR